MFDRETTTHHCFKPGGKHMTIENILGQGELQKEPVAIQQNLHRVQKFYHRVVDLAEQNHKTAVTLVEENGRLENENEGLREFCQELLGSLADLERECSQFRQKVRAAVLELTPHKKEDKHD
jgi:DNA repair exonuclease SbcCD ATPase subunit